MASQVMACDSRQNSTLNSVLHTFHFVTQIVFCIQIVKIKFYFVFQILFCFEFSSVAQILFYFEMAICLNYILLHSGNSLKFNSVSRSHLQILFCL